MAKKRKKTVVTEKVEEEAKIVTVKKRKEEYIKLNFKSLELSKTQEEFSNKILDNDITFVYGPAGTSKAQPLYSKILTPNGWVFMKNIKVGDYVIGQDGNKKRVTGIFPYKEKMVYKVLMSDGSYTKCCIDHFWFTKTLKNSGFIKRLIGTDNLEYSELEQGSVKPLSEIKDTLKVGRKYNHYIPLVEPVNFNKKELPINPYIMGLLLGGKSFINFSLISLRSVNNEIINYILENFNDNDLKIYVSKGKTNDLNITDLNKNSKSKVNKIYNILKNLGLQNKFSSEKFIPNNYLFSSIEDRLELLYGLMDINGYVSKHIPCFDTTSHQLVKDITFLVNSLGGIVNIKKYNNNTYKKNKKTKQYKNYYTINIRLKNIIPFKLESKKHQVKIKAKYFPVRKIIDIVECGKKPVKCISIDSEDGLYVTDNFIVTHNTFSTCYTALQMLQEKKIKQIIITKPIQESGEKLGFLPGNIDEKVLPYLESFYGNIEKIIQKEDLKKLIENEHLIAKPLAYLRGATFDDSIMILDEAQNCDFRQLMLYISRMGKNTKVVVAGDISQYDIEEGTIAMPKFIEMVKNIKGVVVHEFTRNDIVRNPILVAITDKYEDWKRKKLITPSKKNGNGNNK